MLLLFITFFFFEPFGWYLICFFCILLFFQKSVRCRVNVSSISLFLFSFSYIVIGFIEGTSLDSIAGNIALFVAPFLFYKFGLYLSNKCLEKEIFTHFLMLIISFSFILFVLVILDIKENGFINFQRELINDNGDELPATRYGLFASLSLVGLPMFIMIPKRFRSIQAYIFLILFILSILTITHLLNRTGLVIAIFLILFIAFYMFNKKPMFFLILLAILCIVFFVIISINDSIGDLVGIYSARNTEDSLLEGARTVRWSYAFKYIFSYPLGWKSKIIPFNLQAHNMWLDIARCSGIIPMCFILVPSISSLYDSYCLYKIKNNTLVALIICLNITTFLSIMVEPMIESCLVYFFITCYIWGVQHGVKIRYYK